MDFDLIIRHGDLLDPGAGISGRQDVGVRAGKVAAIAPSLKASTARETIDATGLFVTPGLIDMHAHVYWGASFWGIEPDPLSSKSGVTTWVDAGTAGAYNFPGFRRWIVEGSRSRVFSFLNVSSIGLTSFAYEASVMEFCDAPLALGTVERNRDLIRGIKVRVDPVTSRGTGIEPMRVARKLADDAGLPIMVHVGKAPPSLDEVFSLLKPGDIMTHCFTGHANRIIDEEGKLLDFVRRAWDEGVILDIGHGTGSFNYTTAEAMIAAGRPPDVISTDTHQMSIQGPMYDMPTTISKFLNLGLSLPDAIERVTSRPASVIGRPDLGTLKVGSVADIALLRLREGAFTFYDSQMNARPGTKKLEHAGTIIGGASMPLIAERETAFWAVLPDHQREVLQPVAR